MAKVVRKSGPGAEKLKFLLQGLKGNGQQGVGWFESAKYEDGTPVAYVASIQEFGSPKNAIPSRSFMRTTIASEQNNWRKLAQDGAEAILDGGYTMPQVLDGIGQQAAGDIANTIASITDPPLKQSTINARRLKMADKKTVGSLTKPLVDSAVMINSVTTAPMGSKK